MASTQAILSALTDMQANAQAALPVIPNNGNPGGAYNMPHGAVQEQPAPPDPYAWLQPSPFMQTALDMIQQMSVRNQQRAATQHPVQPLPDPPSVMPAPAPTPQQAPVIPAMDQHVPSSAPILPVWAS